MKTRYVSGLPTLGLPLSCGVVDCVVDTGFSGSLMLPWNVIEKIGGKRDVSAEFMLADGSLDRVNTYLANISWLGRNQLVRVVESPQNVALIGMGLLHDVCTHLEPARGILWVS